MDAFTKVEGVVCPLDRSDVDTDQIIPKQFLKRIERTGYGQFLFYDWRLDEDGAERPGFELNRPEFRGGSILLAGRNFGCGSSREHAPWGLQEHGFEAIVAPSFGDIFRTNCVKIGLVPVVLPQEQVKALMEEPGEITVDLKAQTAGPFPFEFDPFERECLLQGLDDIGRALRHEDEIAAYEAAHAPRFATTAL